MKLTIEDYRGFWKAELNGRSEFGSTLEDLLQRMVPDAPEDYIWRTAEVLGTVLGAQVVPTAEINFQALADAMFSAQDDADHWEPTDAQKQYFADGQTDITEGLGS